MPRGTTAERPDLSNNDQGYIRYNAETSQFEGYGAGGAWGSLGGVTDVDQDTFVSAENAAGEDNDELKFFTAGSERMVIDACGNIGIKNSTPTVTLDLSGASDAVKLPIGTTAHRPDTSGNDGLGYIRYNTETSQFEGNGAGNTWGSLGGVTDVDQDTKIVAEVSAGADNDALQFITAGSERLTITSEGDLSLNKTIVLNKKLPIGMSEASFVTVTPTQASLAAASWSTTTNGVDVNWDVASSSFLVTANGQYPSYYVFDASFGNTLDTSTLSTDSSGNFVDASGVIVRDASGNTLDASGNVIEVVSHSKATTADLNGILSIDSDLTTTGANQIIYTYSAANHRTLKFTAQIEHDSSSSYHAEEVLLTHNDSNVAMTTYAQVLLDSNLGTFDADINSGNVRIKFSPTKTNTSIKLRAIRTPA